MTDTPRSLTEAGIIVLTTADAGAKCRSTARFAGLWAAGDLPAGKAAAPPERPARPQRPPLLAPTAVPRRKINRGTAGRIALLHALAHIELNAIDLAWDMISRFAGPDLPRAFFDDWVKVAEEEARHFTMLAARLADFDATYGDFPAHDGLWDAASQTRHDFAARLAIVPLVLEARGLDVTPAMIAKLRQVEDKETAAILETIYRDEIGHVEIGHRWFEYACGELGVEPAAHWRDMVRRHFRGELKPPFNVSARDAAGLPEAWYRTPVS